MMRLALLSLVGVGPGGASLLAGGDPTRAGAPPTETLSSAGDAPRPNMLLTVVDDWGSGDVSWNDGALHTPELQRMSENGFVLDNFYAAATCTPARAMLMTGRYNIRNGMQDSVIHSTEPRGVPLDERFLSQKLSDAGYRTAAVGKWHLGMHREAYTPLKRGFDLFYGILTGGGSHTGHFSVSQPFTVRGQSDTTMWQGYNLWENGSPSSDNYGTTHSTHLYTAKAKEYIEAFESDDFSLASFFAAPEAAKGGDGKKGDAKKGGASSSSSSSKKDDAPSDKKKGGGGDGKKGRRLDEKQPWFVYLSYQAVHDPVTVGDDRYVSETACANVTTASPASRMDAAISATNRPILCGMIAEIDDGLKTLRLSLEATKAWAQTVFVVHSDNGGVRSHGSANYPLRGEKAQYYEGGVKVPAVVAGGYVEEALRRAGAAKAVRIASLAHLTDIHATFLSLGGYEATDADRPLDGVDLFGHLVKTAADPAASDNRPPRTEVLININSALFAGSGAVRVGDYKLMVNPEPNESAIYSKVRKALAAQKGAVPTDTFQAVVAQAHKDALGGASVLLFDLRANPYERTDCATGDAASCNLYEVAAYADVRNDLEQRWASWQQEAQPSSFAWEDDGPLADPALFDNMWAPWRDGDDTPKAHYFGLLGMDKTGDADAAADADAAPAEDFATRYAATALDAETVAASPAAASTGLVALVSFVVGAVFSSKVAAVAHPGRAGRTPLP